MTFISLRKKDKTGNNLNIKHIKRDFLYIHFISKYYICINSLTLQINCLIITIIPQTNFVSWLIKSDITGFIKTDDIKIVQMITKYLKTC